MQNATKLYRVIKAIQGLILVALGLVICFLFQEDGLKNAIGYCVAAVVLIYGVLTIAFSYMFQRGIASSDMISGTVLAALSVFLFVNPSLVIQFIPIVAASALFIYSLILIIETIIAFVHKAYLRGSLYILATLCFLTLGGVSVYYFLQEDGLNIVVMLIGIILILAGLTLSVLALIQPKQEVILQGSTLVEETTKEIEHKSNVPAKKSSKTASKAKNTKQNEVKQLTHNESKPAKITTKKKDSNKKATDKNDSDDVIIVDQTDK